jgi:hypothetical protein
VASNQSLFIRIFAKDDASAGIASVGRGVASLGGSVDGVSAKWGPFGRGTLQAAATLDKMKGPLREIATQSLGVSGGFGAIAAEAISAFGAGGPVIAAVAAGTAAFGFLFTSIRNDAKEAETAVQNLARAGSDLAAKRLGIDPAALRTGVTAEALKKQANAGLAALATDEGTAFSRFSQSGTLLPGFILRGLGIRTPAEMRELLLDQKAVAESVLEELKLADAENDKQDAEKKTREAEARAREQEARKARAAAEQRLLNAAAYDRSGFDPVTALPKVDDPLGRTTRSGVGLNFSTLIEQNLQAGGPFLRIKAPKVELIGLDKEIETAVNKTFSDNRVLQFAQLMDDISTGMNQAIHDALVDGLVSGIQAAVANGSLMDGFKAFAGTLLAGLGAAMVSFGKQMIAFGIQVQIFKKALFSNPAVAIAAGLALVAIGSALQKAGNSIFSGSQGSSGASGGSSDSAYRGSVQAISAETSAPIIYQVPREVGANPNDPAVHDWFAKTMRAATGRRVIREDI